MVLAVSEAVKRRCARKIELPNKTSVACGLCSQSVQRIMETGQIVPPRISRLHVCIQTVSLQQKHCRPFAAQQIGPQG